MTGRRGRLICAMGAIDMALWDIRGQASGKPIWQLLGGQPDRPVVPYASLLPTGDTVAEHRPSLVAKASRRRPWASRGQAGSLHQRALQPQRPAGGRQRWSRSWPPAARRSGRDFTLMVDVAYAWPNAGPGAGRARAAGAVRLFFVETPIDIDDLEGYASLHERSPIRIAAGEWQNTHWEFLDLADRGKIDVLQPDVGRVGGFSEARQVCRIAEERGRLIVPHCWKSAIGIAASAHLAAATGVCPYIEYLPAELSESPLRANWWPTSCRLSTALSCLRVGRGWGFD